MLVYLKPCSTFPKLHSDTLFGALTYAINELYPNVVVDMINKFENFEPPFLVSSSFPYIGDKNSKIRFYPKIILDNNFSNLRIDDLKKYKNIQYFDEDIFLKIINNELTELEIITNLDSYDIINSKFLTKKEINPREFGFGKNIIPNNKINRLTNETEIFYNEGDSYKNSGLFFIVKFFDRKYESILISAIKFLKDRGFGRDISTGKGHFCYEIEKNDFFNDFNQGNSFISLSRYIPCENELKKIKNNSFYEIGSKRGRSSSGEIRKQIRFFNEGSTFPNFQSNYGQIINSGKVNPSIEYGYAFPIKFNVGDIDEL